MKYRIETPYLMWITEEVEAESEEEAMEKNSPPYESAGGGVAVDYGCSVYLDEHPYTGNKIQQTVEVVEE